MPTTSPDGIYLADTGTSMSMAAISAAEATSVQAALGNRQRFGYVWANSAARTAQTGMTTGSEGYQLDTSSEYIYSGGSWRLKTPYAEFLGTVNMTANAWSSPSTLAIQTGLSTDTTFVTVSTSAGNTWLTFAQAGIYSITMTTVIATTVGALAQFSPNTGTTAPLAIVSSVTNNTNSNLSLPLPFIRTTATNQQVYLFYYNNSATTPSATTTVRVGRLG